MATPVGFEGANAIFYGAGEVRDLQTFVGDGRIISAWRLSPEELEEVARTGVVWLVVYGTQPQPALVTGTSAVEVDGKPSVVEPIIPLRPLAARA